MSRRVVVTGCGLVSSLGNTPQAAFERLKRLENCVERSEDLATYKGLQSRLWAPCHYVRPAEFTRKVIRTMSPVSEMALFATERAIGQAELDSVFVKGGRLGVAYGSCAGGMDANMDFMSVLRDHDIKRLSSSTYIKAMPQTCAVNLSVHFGTTGRIMPTGTACTSGSLAIGVGYEMIAYGLQDAMIVGGAEEFSPTQVAVFDTLFATSRKNDDPKATPKAYDKTRDGLVIGEGAGTLVLEEREHAIARGATILAEIVGFGSNTDGCHVTQPNRDTMAKAMSLAIEGAGLAPDAVKYVNSHGTATELGDIAECQAMDSVFGAFKPAVSTIKSYIGHTLGACGAIEAIMTIEMMRNSWFSPNLNLSDPDPRCGEQDFIMGSGRVMDCEFAMTNNFAFGGVNTSIVLSRP